MMGAACARRGLTRSIRFRTVTEHLFHFSAATGSGSAPLTSGASFPGTGTVSRNSLTAMGYVADRQAEHFFARRVSPHAAVCGVTLRGLPLRRLGRPLRGKRSRPDPLLPAP